MKRSIPILLYHHISPDREITPLGLERQLKHMLAKGYQSLSITEAADYVDGKISLNRPGFVVTFDDGYLDNWVHAFPILEKLSVKSVFYLVTERVESEQRLRGAADCEDTKTAERETGGFLSWKEARTMAQSTLVTFGSHTHTHRHFKRKTLYDTVESELQQSKSLIETNLGRPCEHLAWPWGDYETDWLPMVAKLGYRTAVTTLSGANTIGSRPLELKRFKVGREDLDWLDGRLLWNTRAWRAQSFGAFYGWDRRFKVWWNNQSPYSHG